MANEHAPFPIERLAPSIQQFMTFMKTSTYFRRRGESGIADFVFGNPHEMPLPGFVQALERHVQPHDKDWFAYKMSEPEATTAAAAALRQSTGIAFEPADIFMTNGAFAAIAVTLRALVAPGDEVLFLSPPWFFYELLIEAAFATPVRVKIEPPAFDLPVDAIAAALTPRTRAILINSPHNPTGRIYPREDLERLAAVLREASAKNGRPVYLLSDEAYRHIVYDNRTVTSPVEVYADTLVLYTYAKTLLTPGERIGYIAAPPTVHDRERLGAAILLAQFASGWAFPNATLQRALGDLEGLSIDIAALTRRRDRMAAALSAMGYEICVPEGTFYMMVRSPIADDLAFTEQLAAHDTFVLPGTAVERPGWFRLSLTASDAMVERGLPGFEAALRSAQT
jgi:aspartate aminotransferase